MKKIIILLLLMIPINVQAKKYYTEYKPYLEGVEERLETTDLMKEEVQTLYHYYKDVRVNTGYYPMDRTYIDRPYKDVNDVILFQRDVTLYKQAHYSGARIFHHLTDFLVKEFSYEKIDFIPETKIYKKDYSVVNYKIEDQKIILEEEVNLYDLLILFDATNVHSTKIKFNNEIVFETGTIINTYPYFEVSFTSREGMDEFIKSIGVYSNAPYQTFYYYVRYIYHCLYYNLEKVVETTNEMVPTYFKKTNKYNYYKRDYINLADYLIVNKNNHDLTKIIINSSLPKEDVKITADFDINKNGVYDLNIHLGEINEKRPLIVLNELEIKEPICEQKEPVKETIIKYIEVPKEIIKHVEVPKEQIKYIELETKCEKEEIIKYIPKRVVETKVVPKYIKEEKEETENVIDSKNENSLESPKKQISGLIFLPIISMIILILLKVKSRLS
ncbi:MAG: hypothetical protein GX864_01595 [Mollicutes bacterium]|nr:hypothetical protein [Mollicutes bacterium]